MEGYAKLTWEEWRNTFEGVKRHNLIEMCQKWDNAPVYNWLRIDQSWRSDALEKRIITIRPERAPNGIHAQVLFAWVAHKELGIDMYTTGLMMRQLVDQNHRQIDVQRLSGDDCQNGPDSRWYCSVMWQAGRGQSA